MDSYQIEVDSNVCVTCSYLSPDGSKLLQLEDIEADGKISAWKLKLWSFPEASFFELPFDIKDYVLVAWSPDSRLVWYGKHIFNVETREIVPLPFPSVNLENTFIKALWLPPSK